MQDPLERCLWSCGIQGKAGLQKFWKTEVEAGTRQLQSEAARLHEQPVPSSLPPPPNPPRPLALSLSSLSVSCSHSLQLPHCLTASLPHCLCWQDLGGEKGDEEISLEDTLATDMSIIAPVRHCHLPTIHVVNAVHTISQATTPDPGGIQS